MFLHFVHLVRHDRALDAVVAFSPAEMIACLFHSRTRDYKGLGNIVRFIARELREYGHS